MRFTVGGLAAALTAGTFVAAAAPAAAADAAPPVLAVATFTPAPNGNGNWFRSGPVELVMRATDDVAVDRFQYSTDAGATYVDVQVPDAATATATVSFPFVEGSTAVRYRAVDTSGNVSAGVTTTTTLNVAAAAGATGVRLQSTAGRAVGDVLVIGTGATSETATIASIPAPAPGAPSANVVLAAPLVHAQAAGTVVTATPSFRTINVQIDSKAPSPVWGTLATTLGAAAAPGTTSVRLSNLAGRAAGDTLQLDQGANAELVTIASIVSPDPGAPGANVVLTAPLTKAHLSGAALYVPSIRDGKVMQSQTLTPLRNDPRLRDATDTVANGAGGAAIRRMLVDGVQVIPKPLPLNTLTVGRHTQSVALQDTAGNAAKHTNTFVVTTSFADLATVIDQYADNALRTTLNGATAAGATSLRFADATRFGFRAGQTLVVDSGANRETTTVAAALTPPATVNSTLTADAQAGATEVRLAAYSASTPAGPNPATVTAPVVGQPIVLGTGADMEVVTIARHIVPLPPAPAPNVVLSAPLAKSHAAGTPTVPATVTLTTPLTLPHASGVEVFHPRPLVPAATADRLRSLLTQARDQAAAGSSRAAVSTLNAFKAAAADLRRTQRLALTSAADALIAEVRGESVDTSGTGVVVSAPDPGDQVLRSFYDPVPGFTNPQATYKVLVNGRAAGFRHQSIVDVEWMIQKLGTENGFSVEVWDNLAGAPGRPAPAGVSLPTSPFLDLATLMEYKTLIFDSTVGVGLNAVEFANLQAYIRAGGGIVSIHGAVDSMQNVPWYMDLVGAGFSNHGSNAGGILIDTESGGHVEFRNADPTNPVNAGLPDRFTTVEEVYNTNRDPVAMGIVHPLVYENEDTLVGQIGYGTGALHNTDKHAMTWCRTFDGGKSFTTTIGHNWQFVLEPWFQTMILNGIEWTADQTYANCVTYAEVAELLAAGTASGALTPSGSSALGAALASARAGFQADDYGVALASLDDFLDATAVAGSGSAAARAELRAKGLELVSWAEGLYLHQAQDDLIVRLVRDDRLSATAAAAVVERLDKAATAALAGNESSAIAYVRQAIARAHSQIKGQPEDAETRQIVVDHLEELIAHLSARRAG